MRHLLAGVIFTLTIISCDNEMHIVDQCCDQDPNATPCHAEPAPIYLPGDTSTGWVKGYKNCLPFLASAFSGVGTPSQNVTGMEISTYIDCGNVYCLKELFSIGAATHEVGTYPFLKNFPNHNYIYYYTFKDLDIVEDFFRIDTTYENTMTITSIDTTDNDHITGWFKCRFIVDFPGSGKNPDTLLFTDCEFSAHKLQ